MVTISNGKNTHSVTLGAFNSIYKARGYHIIGRLNVSTNETVKNTEVEENTEVAEVQEAEEIDNNESADENDWVAELLEKPISQWSKEETANFAKEKGIDTSRARKLGEAKDIIKNWLDKNNM